MINTLDPLGNGNIFSDALGENISTNGYHEAIQVGDTEFDNINTNGHYGCQGRSKTKPVGRSKSRPVVGSQVVEYSGAKGLWSVAEEALRP